MYTMKVCFSCSIGDMFDEKILAMRQYNSYDKGILT